LSDSSRSATKRAPGVGSKQIDLRMPAIEDESQRTRTISMVNKFNPLIEAIAAFGGGTWVEPLTAYLLTT